MIPRFLLAAAMLCAAPFAAAAQEAVPLSQLPTLADNGADFCGYLRDRKAAGLTESDRSAIAAELSRRGGFSGADRRILSKPVVDIGPGMTLQGLRCALGGQVRIVKRWDYGTSATWQAELFPDFWNYTVRHVYLYGNGTAQGMRVGSLPELTLTRDDG